LPVGAKSIGSAKVIKFNENNMLNRRFAIAPMMDWTDLAEKAKYNQHLSMVAIGHVVPNAVPHRRRALPGE
jgi:tRNA-dihydrouridine synthase